MLVSRVVIGTILSTAIVVAVGVSILWMYYGAPYVIQSATPQKKDTETTAVVETVGVTQYADTAITPQEFEEESSALETVLERTDIETVDLSTDLSALCNTTVTQEDAYVRMVTLSEKHALTQEALTTLLLEAQQIDDTASLQYMLQKHVPDIDAEMVLRQLCGLAPLEETATTPTQDLTSTQQDMTEAEALVENVVQRTTIFTEGASTEEILNARTTANALFQKHDIELSEVQSLLRTSCGVTLSVEDAHYAVVRTIAELHLREQDILMVLSRLADGESMEQIALVLGLSGGSSDIVSALCR